MRKSEESYVDEWGKKAIRNIWGKVKKVMKINKENLRKSEEIYEDKS